MGSFAAKILTLVMTLCAGQATTSQLTLQDLDGKAVNPFTDAGAKAVVFVFARVDCPISNRYAPEVGRLREKFAAAKIKFWLVYPDKDTSASAIRNHLKDFPYNCDALRDPRHELIKATGVSVTPEAVVFVLDRSGPRMSYRGRIDDQYSELGKHRPAPTTHDLEDAIAAVVRNETAPFKSTPAVGCYISDLNQSRER
jgi:peroxiredoxin